MVVSSLGPSFVVFNCPFSDWNDYFAPDIAMKLLFPIQITFWYIFNGKNWITNSALLPHQPPYHHPQQQQRTVLVFTSVSELPHGFCWPLTRTLDRRNGWWFVERTRVGEGERVVCGMDGCVEKLVCSSGCQLDVDRIVSWRCCFMVPSSVPEVWAGWKWVDLLSVSVWGRGKGKLKRVSYRD